MKYHIKNFTEADTLEIVPTLYESRPLVHITSDGGSLHFQHTLTTEQAYAMSVMLVTAACDALAMKEASEVTA